MVGNPRHQVCGLDSLRLTINDSAPLRIESLAHQNLLNLGQRLELTGLASTPRILLRGLPALAGIISCTFSHLRLCLLSHADSVSQTEEL